MSGSHGRAQRNSGRAGIGNSRFRRLLPPLRRVTRLHRTVFRGVSPPSAADRRLFIASCRALLRPHVGGNLSFRSPSRMCSSFARSKTKTHTRASAPRARWSDHARSRRAEQVGCEESVEKRGGADVTRRARQLSPKRSLFPSEVISVGRRAGRYAARRICARRARWFFGFRRCGPAISSTGAPAHRGACAVRSAWREIFRSRHCRPSLAPSFVESGSVRGLP